MRHRNYGRKLSRNTEHRRALLRNLVTSLILQERIVTTVAKAKAARPVAERLITWGKRGDLHARRLAARTCIGPESGPKAVQKLFGDLAKRYADRPGGYTRIIHAGWRVGDGADLAVLELVGTGVLQKLAERRARKTEARQKKDEAEAAAKQQPQTPPPDEGGEKK